MISRILRRLRSLFVRRSATVLAPQTLIDRHLWALGYDVGERELCDRIRRLELTLAEHWRQLQARSPDGTVAGEQAAQLRGAIAAYLERPGGVFERAVLGWPSADPSAESFLRRVVCEGERLRDQAEEAHGIADLVAQLRGKHAVAETQFGTVLPRLWHSTGAGILDRMERLHSRAAVESLTEEMAVCVQRLQAHLADLAKLEGDLLTRNRLPADDVGLQAIRGMQDVELRLSRLIELAEAQARQVRAVAHMSVDTAVTAHLGHRDVKRPNSAVRGKSIGSAARSMTRWRQLMRLPEDC